MVEINLEVDTSGLNCPLPLLRLKKALTTMQSGEIVKLLATDPAAHLDIGVFVEQSGHHLVTVTKTSQMQEFIIKKK